MLYVDNAATSYPKPQSVIETLTRALTSVCGNPGRGSHAASIEASKDIFIAREKIAAFFNIKNPTRLVFTKNATEALNIAIKGSLYRGDHVITTSMEHNSVLRPLHYLASIAWIELTIIWGDKQGNIDVKKLENSIRSNTKLIVMSLSSNVTGTLLPIKEVTDLSRTKKILFLLDAAQGAGSIPINIETMPVDMMAFPGHKSLFGPQGTGGLYIREGLMLRPLLMGGTGSLSESLVQPEWMPDRFESGTLNVPGILGLAAGVEFIESVGIANISRHKGNLTCYFIQSLQSISKIQIYSSENPKNNSGIVGINFRGVDAFDLSNVLDAKYAIRTRGGFHCAPLAHKTLGTTKQGLVRFSFSYLNSLPDVERCIAALNEISKNLRE